MTTTMTPTPTTDRTLYHARLISAVIQFDMRHEGKRGYNRHALGIYFLRVDDIDADIARGADPRAAIVAGFTGSVLAFVLRKLLMDPPTEAERNGIGSVTYKPAV